MTCYPQYMSIVIFMFSYTKYHFSWISLVFLSGIVIFYCGTWGNMKRCLFLLVFAVNFNVSMKRHMLIVSLFLLVVASTSSACCNMFFFKVSDFLVFPHEIAHFMKVVVFFKRKSTVFTATRGVIWRAVSFLNWYLQYFFLC